MITNEIISGLIENLEASSISDANERLPKEEQIRCHLYHLLIRPNRHICAEHRYGSIDEKPKYESDLWVRESNGNEHWIEIKTAWFSSDLNNKVPLQLQSWIYDISKLATASSISDRSFILIALTNFDTQSNDAKDHPLIKSLNAISEFPPKICCSKTFHWPHAQSVTHITSWVWHWGVNEVIPSA